MSRFLALENVEMAAGLHADSFFIPSAAERRSQPVGASVKLHFLLDSPGQDEPRAERMWVTVTREHGLFHGYRGRLQNQPVHINNLQAGDEINFKPCHIAQTIIAKNDPRWIDCFEKMALVSKKCFEGGEFVRFLYRQEPDRPQDSGWRMFSGHETAAFNEDAKNIRVVLVAFLLDKDPTLLQPLKAQTGSVFERTNRSSPWMPVIDWHPED